MKHSRHILNSLRLILAVTAIACACIFFNPASIWSKIKSAHLGFIAAAFIAGWVSLLLGTLKLKLSFGYFTDISFVKIFSSLLTGKVYNFFTPGSLGSDANIAFSFRTDKNGLGTTIGVMLADRILSIPSIAIIMLFCLPFCKVGMPPMLRAITIGTAVIAMSPVVVYGIFFIVARSPAKRFFIYRLFGGRLQKVTVFLDIVLKQWKRSIAIMAVGVLVNGTIQAGTFFLLKAVNINIDPFYSFAVLPVNSFLTMLPVSVMGIGLREGGFFYLLSPYTITMEEVIAFNLIGYSFELIMTVIAGIVTAGSAIWATLRQSRNIRKPQP